MTNANAGQSNDDQQPFTQEQRHTLGKAYQLLLANPRKHEENCADAAQDETEPRITTDINNNRQQS